MKKVFCLLVVMFSMALYAQEKNPIILQSLSLSSGEGPLSSGLFFEANFKRGDDIVNMYLGERDLCAYYLKSLGSSIYLGPSWEYYYNVPVLGFIMLSTPVSFGRLSISNFSWAGLSAGRPEQAVTPFKWSWLFVYNSLSLNYKGFSLSGALMWYDTWGHLLDLKYTRTISSHFQVFSSAGYSWYGNEKALLKIGLTYRVNSL